MSLKAGDRVEVTCIRTPMLGAQPVKATTYRGTFEGWTRVGFGRVTLDGSHGLGAQTFLATSIRPLPVLEKLSEI